MECIIPEIKVCPICDRLLQKQIDILAKKSNEACFSIDNDDCNSDEGDCDEDEDQEGEGIDDQNESIEGEQTENSDNDGIGSMYIEMATWKRA